MSYNSNKSTFVIKIQNMFQSTVSILLCFNYSKPHMLCHLEILQILYDDSKEDEVVILKTPSAPCYVDIIQNKVDHDTNMATACLR